jgi:uncharacterized protein (DUF2062 family)
MVEAAFRPVVIAPTYNNVRTLGDVLDRVRAQGLHAIVVNDGSTDGTAEVLAARLAGVHAGSLTVLTHRRNRGKGTALQTGFAAARRAGFTHAVTIDTDGQLDPEEIPLLLAAARRSPEALVIGRRDPRGDGYPAKSRIGRSISNAFVRLECGVRVDDSQCGFRVYPLGLLRAAGCCMDHYGFETEVITRAGWAGCPVEEVPVTCRYLAPERRVSHFRPFRDTIRGVLMHFYLTSRALAPFPKHPRWPVSRGVVIADEEPIGRRLLKWFSPRQAWRQLRESRVGRTDLAAGLAAGVFIANLPAYGFQSLLSLYAARRLQLHPLSVLLGSHASTPPVGPLLVAAAIAVGHFVFHGALPAASDFDPRRAGWSGVVGPILLEWAVGGVLLGTAMAAATFAVAATAMRLLGGSEQATATEAVVGDATVASQARSAA